MDELCIKAPMLATYSLLPIIQRFAKPMGVEVRMFINHQYSVQYSVVYTMYNTLYGIAVASEFCGEVQPPNFQHNLFSVSHVL